MRARTRNQHKVTSELVTDSRAGYLVRLRSFACDTAEGAEDIERIGERGGPVAWAQGNALGLQTRGKEKKEEEGDGHVTLEKRRPKPYHQQDPGGGTLGAGSSESDTAIVRIESENTSEKTSPVLAHHPNHSVVFPIAKAVVKRRRKPLGRSYSSPEAAATGTEGLEGDTEELVSRKTGKRARLKRAESEVGTTMTRRVTKGTSAAPAGWKTVYEAIRRFRDRHEAPVDTMGCSVLGSNATTLMEYRWQSLCSLMLSSQTRDEMTARAMSNVRSAGLVSAHSVHEADPGTLMECIKPVGFYRRKTEYLKKAAAVCVARYSGDIPPTLEELLKLVGVGPKMAHLAMQICWNRSEGVGVDVHVHRICNRLGWVRSHTPERTRVQLEQWLPRELWADINGLLVGFGQTLCRPVGPKCSQCPVRDSCPSAGKSPSPSISSTKAAKPKAKRESSPVAENDMSSTSDLGLSQSDLSSDSEFG